MQTNLYQYFSPTASASSSSTAHGKIAVGKYFPPNRSNVGNIEQVCRDGFEPVVIHVSNDGIGGPLSPFNLKNEFGQCLENVWQFSKIYRLVTAQDTNYWHHGSEFHSDWSPVGHIIEPNDAYWNWRAKGMHAHFAVRYPNGFDGKAKCVCSIVTKEWLANPATTDPSKKNEYTCLSYIEARKQIYCAEYARLAPSTVSFKKLKYAVDNGKNLLLLEVDGPPPWMGLTYPYNQIDPENPALILNERVIKALLSDPSRPFGHGYTLGALLLNGEEWLK